MKLEEEIKQSFFNLFERKRDQNVISVSSLPWCLRREFFNIKFNANPAPNERMVRGTIYHLAIRHLDVLRDCEFEVEAEWELKDGYRLVGHADAYDPVMKEVYEFKFTENINNTETTPFYFAQANTYAAMLEAAGFYLVLVNPRTFDTKVLEAETDIEAFKAMRERAIMLIDCLESNVIPQGPEREWECKNCVYSIICKNLKDEQRRLE